MHFSRRSHLWCWRWSCCPTRLVATYTAHQASAAGSRLEPVAYTCSCVARAGSAAGRPMPRPVSWPWASAWKMRAPSTTAYSSSCTGRGATPPASSPWAGGPRTCGGCPQTPRPHLFDGWQAEADLAFAPGATRFPGASKHLIKLMNKVFSHSSNYYWCSLKSHGWTGLSDYCGVRFGTKLHKLSQGSHKYGGLRK